MLRLNLTCSCKPRCHTEVSLGRRGFRKDGDNSNVKLATCDWYIRFGTLLSRDKINFTLVEHKKGKLLGIFRRPLLLFAFADLQQCEHCVDGLHTKKR